MSEKQFRKEQLEKQTVNELKVIAKNVGVKGYSNKRKKQLIGILINKKYDITPYIGHYQNNEKKYSFNDFWKKYIDGYVRVLTAIIVCLITIITTIRTCDTRFSPYFLSFGEEFKILILPLTPDRNCNIVDTEYEQQIANYYNKITDSLSINLTTKIAKNLACPQTEEEVQKIGEKENADIVIWGNYDEFCSGPTKVRIRYRLIDSIGISIPVSGGHKDMKPLNDLSELRSGSLINSMDYIIYKTLIVSLFNRSNFGQCIDLSNKIVKRECDIEIEFIKNISLRKLGRETEADKILKEIIVCLFQNSGRLKKALETNKELNLGNDFLSLCSEIFLIWDCSNS